MNSLMNEYSTRSATRFRDKVQSKGSDKGIHEYGGNFPRSSSQVGNEKMKIKAI